MVLTFFPFSADSWQQTKTNGYVYMDGVMASVENGRARVLRCFVVFPFKVFFFSFYTKIP